MRPKYQMRQHLATLNSAGKPKAVAERKIHQAACRLARKERRAKYPVITAENFEEADEYQKQRIAYWGGYQ